MKCSDSISTIRRQWEVRVYRVERRQRRLQETLCVVVVELVVQVAMILWSRRLSWDTLWHGCPVYTVQHQDHRLQRGLLWRGDVFKSLYQCFQALRKAASQLLGSQLRCCGHTLDQTLSVLVNPLPHLFSWKWDDRSDIVKWYLDWIRQKVDSVGVCDHVGHCNNEYDQSTGNKLNVEQELRIQE